MNLDLAPETQTHDDVAVVARAAAIQKHIAWMKENSPDWETADPYAVDWQAVKAEGRRY